MIAAVVHVALRLPHEPAWTVCADVASNWPVPAVILGLLGYGYLRGVRVYDSLVAGARDGFNVAVRIIPYMVAIMVAVAMFDASGARWGLERIVAPVLEPLGLPIEGFAMAIVRSLSGSGGLALLGEVLRTRGPDSFVGYLVSTINGSSETTFYVLAVYFGAIGVRRIRHTMWAALIADLAGVVASVILCRIMFT
jgi:spore maturation protein SpmB